jgi:hypothetical protein
MVKYYEQLKTPPPTPKVEPARPPPKPSLKLIMHETALAHNVLIHGIKSKSRTKSIVDCRLEYYYRATKETLYSYSAIGRFCGDRDHTTVMSGVDAYCKRRGIPHPRDPHTTIYERKQAQQRRYKAVLRELNA